MGLDVSDGLRQSLGMDLESYRTSEDLTYRELRDRLGLKNKAGLPRDESNVRRIARGLEWPAPDTLSTIIEKCRGVSLAAMAARYQTARKAKIADDRSKFEQGAASKRELEAAH
jgi:hypothetical protein